MRELMGFCKLGATNNATKMQVFTKWENARSKFSVGTSKR
jgi:hypothetical protein